MVSEYADSHQEMSLMLAIPGLAVGRAPMLSLEQAGNILRVINEPLACLKVGRLTRNLAPRPEELRATEDVGTLTLWLSPPSDIRVIWQSLKNQGEGTPSGVASVEDDDSLGGVELTDGFHEMFSLAEVSEELAWVAADSACLNGGTGIKLEMVEQDPSGRSFKLSRRSQHVRQKQDLAARLAEEKARAGGQVSSEMAKLFGLLNACSNDPEMEENFFFWIAEKSLSKGLKVLQIMSEQLNSLPTLSEKSGVPEVKLQEVYQWFTEVAKASLASQEQRDEHTATAGSAAEVAGHPSSDTPVDTVQTGIYQGFLPLPSQLMAALNPTYFLDALFHDASRIPLDFRNGSQVGVGGNVHQICEACASSATANFLVSDKRLGMTLLSTASVTVAAGVEGSSEVLGVEEAQRAASDCAHRLAKKRAEAGARAEAERIGRRRLEELAAERAAKPLAEAKSAYTDAKGRAESQQSAPGSMPTQRQSVRSMETSSSPASASDNNAGLRPPLESIATVSRGPCAPPSTSSSAPEDCKSKGNVKQSNTQWRPRVSRSVRGWGGNDLQCTGPNLFNSSSAPSVAETVLPHEQAFGYHGKQANWHNHSNVNPLPLVDCMGIPALIPAHWGQPCKGIPRPYQARLAVPTIPPVPPPVISQNPRPENPWHHWQGAWSQRPNTGCLQASYLSGHHPFGVNSPFHPRLPNSAQFWTPVYPAPMPYHHYGRLHGYHGALGPGSQQDPARVPGQHFGTHGWNAGHEQWAWQSRQGVLAAGHEGSRFPTQGWGGMDLELTDPWNSVVGNNVSAVDRPGATEGTKRKSRNGRRN